LRSDSRLPKLRAQERGRAFYEQIGRKGGETVKAERGHEFYEQIGRKGGESVRASRGPAFYSEIGHKGGQKVRELIEQGKRMAQAQKEAGGLDEHGNLKDGLEE